ncbi:ubiquitin-conjugating enzyme/RWD-like protein [Cladochytrium replicatum]|nr:ubiquitin-conjugating enzyme/RWD-like protein [Cladochytrium replicatum]
MATKGAYKRLSKEYLAIRKNPPPFIVAKPTEANILEWHYIVRGPPASPYEGGEYHGKLIFPSDYPYKPPAIKMITPNGRFQTDFRLCLTMSDYHPGSWNPAWSVSTILTGLLSFMLEDTRTTGSITTSTDEKRLFARKSHEWNLKNQKFREIFPEFCTPELLPLPNQDPVPVPPSPTADATPPQTAQQPTPPPPSSSSITHRKPSDPQQPSSSASSSSTVAHPGAAPANALRSAWDSIRSNLFVFVILLVFSYLVGLKVVSRVGSGPWDTAA